MSLAGVSADNPRPALRREYVFGAGPSTGTSPDRPILIVGNKTSSGSETVDVISDDFIVDDADAKARFGPRSEWYGMYRQITAVPQDATIYGVCPTESGGTAANVELTVGGGDSDASSTWKIHVHGETIQYSAESGDEEQATGEGIRDAINDHDSGRLQVSATAAIDGAGPDWAVTVTVAQKGPRGIQIIGAIATRGIRVKAVGTNTQTVVKKVASYSAGTTDDDHTAAIAEIASGEYYYQVTAATAVSTVTATDNQLGEHATMIAAQALPINGKDQRLFYATVGTNAEAVAVAISSAMNTVYGHQFWQENSDFSPPMVAAHCMAVIRQGEISHPAFNSNGWTAGDGKIFNLPAPYLKADYPTNGEIVTALNNGVSPISFVGNRVVLERFITTRSLNGTGNNDYKAREGHIPSVVHFFWAIASQRYQSIRQPFADDDPAEGQMPTARTMIPSTIESMLHSLIDDMVSSQPLGKYRGPILKPSAKAEMKASTKVTYAGGGSFPTEQDIKSVEHDIKWETLLRETGDDY